MLAAGELHLSGRPLASSHAPGDEGVSLPREPGSPPVRPHRPLTPLQRLFRPWPADARLAGPDGGMAGPVKLANAGAGSLFPRDVGRTDGSGGDPSPGPASPADHSS